MGRLYRDAQEVNGKKYKVASTFFTLQNGFRILIEINYKDKMDPNFADDERVVQNLSEVFAKKYTLAEAEQMTQAQIFAALDDIVKERRANRKNAGNKMLASMIEYSTK